MATHPSILAWRIQWTEEPGGLQFMGLQRVGQNRQFGYPKAIFYIFYLFIKHFVMFIYSSPGFIKHLFNHFLELFIRWIASLHFNLFFFFPRIWSYPLMWNIFFFSLILCLFLCIGNKLHFPILEEWLYVGDVQWDPAMHSPLFIIDWCSNVPHVGCTGPSAVTGLIQWAQLYAACSLAQSVPRPYLK